MLCFCFVYLRLMYPVLPVSLDCPFFFIAPSVFSNVYFRDKLCVTCRFYLYSNQCFDYSSIYLESEHYRKPVQISSKRLSKLGCLPDKKSIEEQNVEYKLINYLINEYCTML